MEVTEENTHSEPAPSGAAEQNSPGAGEQHGGTPEGVDVADGHKAVGEEAQSGAAGEKTAEENAAQEQEASAETAQPESDLERAEREITELKDSWNRERADFANFRKRTIQERARAQGEAVAKFTRELLDVMDNLDRVLSIESDNAEVQNFVTGVEMIRSSFVGVFQNHNIRVSNPLNEAFDPMSMEAIAREERPDLSADTVLEVYQSGYTIDLGHGEMQTLRPARVKVGVAAKAGSAEKSGGDSDAGEANE